METRYLHCVNQEVSGGEEILPGLRLEFRFDMKEGVGAPEAPSALGARQIRALKILHFLEKPGAKDSPSTGQGGR